MLYYNENNTLFLLLVVQIFRNRIRGCKRNQNSAKWRFSQIP